MTQIQTSTTPRDSAAINPYLVLAIAITVGSLAPTFIRLAQQSGAEPLAIVAGRLLLATIALTPVIVTQHRDEFRRLSAGTLMLAGFAGFWLILHFTLLIIALENTSVLISTVLINASPIWVALLETFFLKARLSRPVWIGLLIAMSGGILIAISSGGSGAMATQYADPVLGGVLAFFSGISAAVYLTVGRRVRGSVVISNLFYIWIVFGTAGILSLVAAGLTGTSLTGYRADGYFWILMLTIFPQLIGHGGFNYVVAYLPATLVSLTSQIVTVVSAIIALFIFAEVPGIPDLIGSTIIITGVVVAITGQNQQKTRFPAESESR